MSKKLVGKVAVVTGASKGIGASIARALAEEGASVVVNYSSSKQDAERVVAEIAARGGKAIAVQADVSKPAHIERLFSDARRSFGRLEVHDRGDAAGVGWPEVENRARAGDSLFEGVARYE